MTNTPAAGHNRPPTHLESAAATISALGDFLSANPTIDHTNATEAATLIDRTRRVVADLEAERKTRVEPLNEQVRDINEEYRPVRDTFTKLLDTLKSRTTDFARREEARREAEAARIRAEAEAARREAEAAEAAERQAAIDSEFGAPADIGTATADADQAFSEFRKADRVASRAERDVPVRLGTGIGRAVSMRTKETLIVEDYVAAIKDTGITPDIHAAILSAARAFRRLNNRLPAGMRAETEKAI